MSMPEDYGVAVRALVQLVQIPLHAMTVCMLAFVWSRAKHRRPWAWILVGMAIVAMRRMAAIYWTDKADAYVLVERGVLPCLSALCQLLFAYLMTKQVRNGGEL